MTYHRSSSRFDPPYRWEKEIAHEDDVFDEEERLQETYPNAEIDAIQDEDHYPFLWCLYIAFKDDADEAEFIMRESL